MVTETSEVFLPSNTKAVAYLRLAALLSGFITIGFSVVMLVLKVVDIYIVAACTTGSLLICFHLVRKPGKSLTLPQKIIGLSSSSTIAIFGIMHISINSQIDLYAITIFCLVVSIFLLSVKIPHRHHFSNLLAFVATLLSAYNFFNATYSILLLNVGISAIHDQLAISILLLLFSQTILLCKPDRGFLGMMTTNTTSSKVSLRFFFYFILIGPLTSFCILLGLKFQFFSNAMVIPLLVTLLTAFSIIMNWLNAKFLYKLELEKYLITEILRVNNIDLEVHSKDLKTQIAELEKEKKDIKDSVDYRNRLKDIISDQG